MSDDILDALIRKIKADGIDKGNRYWIETLTAFGLHDKEDELTNDKIAVLELVVDLDRYHHDTIVNNKLKKPIDLQRMTIMANRIREARRQLITLMPPKPTKEGGADE